MPRRFIRFAFVGLGATAVHVVIAAHLIATHMVSAALGNAIAFVCANVCSYLCQSFYVFETRPETNRYGRFLTVSLMGLVVVAAVSKGLDALGVHYLVGIAVVVLVVPIATFGFHTLWTFREGGEGQACH